MLLDQSYFYFSDLILNPDTVKCFFSIPEFIDDKFRDRQIYVIEI